VNNNQATTFKSSLANAAFISSHGQAYRLFHDTDDPALGNDFVLNDFEFQDLEFNKTRVQNEFSQIDNYSEVEVAVESDVEMLNVVGAENIFCNENYQQTEELHDQFSDQPIHNNESDIVTVVDNAGGFGGSEDLGRQFNVLNGDDCELMIAELLALEVPKPIINVPENIPPQELPFDEKIKRLRGVAGICGKFQPTIHEKILSNIDSISENIAKLRFFVSKKPKSKLSATNDSTIHKIHQHQQNTPITERLKSENKLSFCPIHDETAVEIDRIIRSDVVVPILDSVPDFFNFVPSTIRFAPNQKKIDRAIQNDDYDNFKIVHFENDEEIDEENDEEADENIVTIIHNDFRNNYSISDDDICEGEVDVDGKVDEVLFRRRLSGYELPDEITRLISRASVQVSDLGERFIDLLGVGKRVISVNGCFAGDGCSLVSVFTAVELVSRGKRVLLVDANCRNPELANFLGVGDILCREVVTLKDNFDFTTVFDKKISTDTETIFRNDKGYSKIGNNFDDQVRAGIDNGLCRFIGGLGDVYDFILFDSGCIADVPFSDCVDSWRLMGVDGVFLVVCKRKFQSVNFNNITERLTEQQIELTGIMVSGD
jgi:hypothetical protein